MNRKMMTAILLILTMLAVPWSGILEGPELPPEKEQAWTTTNPVVASQDTMLNSSAENTTHGSHYNLNLSSIYGVESYILYSFPLIQNTTTGGLVPGGSSIQSAWITIYPTSAQTMGGNHVYAAMLNGGFDEGNTTWLNQTHNTTWQKPGAQGDADHDNWEPRASITSSSSSVALNVTALAQQAQSTLSPYLDVIVSMSGSGTFTLASSEHPTTAKRPSFTATYVLGAPSNASISISGPANGTIAMENALALSADTTPTMSWSNHVGTDVEMQVSRKPDFRSENDSDDWVYNSWGGSGFTSNGANGTFTVPSGSSLDEGMVGYWRTRSTNSDQLSEWDYGYFLLPEHDTTSNSNGTATFQIYHDSLNMSRGTVEDAWLRSGSSNISSGNNENMWVGHSNTSSWGKMNSIIKVDIPDTGLYTNATVLSAYMNLRRTGRQGTPWISIHQMWQDNWSAEDATWDTYDGINSWGTGGAYDQIISGALDVQRANKSGPTFNFDVTYAAQEYLRKANSLGGYQLGGYQWTEGMSFLLSSQGEVDEWIKFGGSGEGAYTYRPSMVITYQWGDGAGPGSTVTVQSPLDGHGVWEVVNEHNLTADLTPTLNWSSVGHTNDDVRIEFASNEDFSEGPLYRVDSRDASSGIDTTAGNFTIPASWGLDYGEDYYWRIRWIEDGDWGDYEQQEMFVSTINSTWISNNTWQIRLRNNNASSTMVAPYCRDTYIDYLGQNSNNDGSQLSISSDQYTLFGCNLKTHALPPGYAVIDAELRMKAEAGAGFGTVTANTYELLNHLWSESDATWIKYNSANNWLGSGASGNERGQLLDFTSLTTSTNWATWNVTVGVQNSMRWDVPVDFLIVGSGSGAAVMYDKENAGSSADYPELVINYRPGSMEVPNPPQTSSPQNGAWTVTDGLQVSPDLRPTLAWNHTGSVAANGWVVELDTTPTFNSNDLREARSWVQINDFDVTNRTYVPSTNLTNGKTWYWHVRGSSLTNQLGNWSNDSSFIVPDLESGSLDENNSYIVIRPGAAVPTQGIPEVPDTWIVSGTNRNVTHQTASRLVVGCTTSDCPKSSLLSFPLDALPQPSNSRIVGAELQLWPYSVNSTTTGVAPRISVHRTLRNWNESVNGISWTGDYVNSTTNWSQLGGIGSGDIGPLIDVGSPVLSSRFDLNVTELVHDAINNGVNSVNMTLRSDTNAYSEAVFHSANYTWSSNRPALVIWYRNGTSSATSTTPTLSSPVNGNITWNLSGHALGSDQTPILTWTQPPPPPGGSSADNWRLFVYNDTNDVRDGYQIFDSRFDAGFDLTNLTWTPSSNFTADAEQRWFVQTIKDDIYGERSNSFTFNVPNPIGHELNSTHARLRVIEGGALTSQSLPTSFADAYLDSYQPTTNRGSAADLRIGRSSYTTNSNYQSWAVMEIDISSLPVPTPWEVTSAEIELYCYGSSSSSTLDVAVFPLLSNFTEMQVTHNNRNSTLPWPNHRADGGFIDGRTIGGVGWYSWNISQLVQTARLRGDDTVLLAFSAHEGATVYKQFHSSERSGANSDLRPVLNITHRIGTQWQPPEAINTVPGVQSTLWQSGEPRPTARDPVVLGWSVCPMCNPSNITSWQIQFSPSLYFYPWNHLDSSDSTTYNGTFDTTNLSYEIDPQGDFQWLHGPTGWSNWPDAWIYWRVRPVIDDSIGNWTNGGEFRVPDDQGSDDGLGNHTVTMYRGSVFESSGVLPSVPDTWIDSTPNAGTTTQQGSNTTLVVGDSPFQSGQESIALLQFDLGELPFPSNMLATTVSLKLYRAGFTASGNAIVGIHDCSAFSESDTWNSYSFSNNCNSTAASTISQSLSGFGTWYDWDITSIVQSAGHNGTVSIAVRTTATNGYIQFASSENTASVRPKLVVGYIDNLNGTQPPTTPVLSWPTDQHILYTIPQSDDFLLDSPVRPTLTWNYAADTTGYIIRLWNTSTQSNPHSYFSWNATANQGTFGQSSFTAGWDMEVGGVYYWNIQGINGSVLGPRSSTWSFAIGNPNTQAMGNNIWQTVYQEGNDVDEFNHPIVEDTYINGGNPSTNYGNEQLRVGENCQPTGIGGAQGDCITIIQIDLAQISLTSDGRAHSGKIMLWLDSIVAPNSGWVDITAYALLNSNFSENQATWIQASLGNNWTTAGLGAGTDRGLIALDTVRISSTAQAGWFSFDVSGAMAANLNGSISIVLVGSAQPVPTGTPQITAIFESSESTSASNRPQFVLNYTSVFDISVTGLNTTTADTQVQMNAILVDVNNNSVTGSVEWSTSDGTIDSNGLFTPDHSGNVSISARFGRIIVTHIIVVQPGVPIVLIGGPSASTITSDQSVPMWFEVLDANNNAVPGIVLTFSVTNGSVAQGNSHTTPVGTLTYLPWEVGLQTINVTWSGGSITLEITVTQGLPSYIIMDGYSSIPAAESRDFNWTAYDAHDNFVTPTRLLSVNWTVEDGNITQTGNYTADKVGFWNVSMTTGYGLSVSQIVETTYGAIQSLEVTPSASAITADDEILIYTVRIDVRGNRLNVTLPASAWVPSNGTIYEETPVRWTPWVAATQTIDATLENVTTRIILSVVHGEVVGIDIRTGDNEILISGNAATIGALNYDQFGNEWNAAIDAWVINEPMADQNWLTPFSSYADFDAVIVGSWTITATYIHGQTAMSDSITFTVEAGPLASITLSGHGSQITADDSVDLNPVTRDQNANMLETDMLRWFIWDAEITPQPSACVDWGNELTSTLQANNHVWDASEEGRWRICSISGAYQAVAEIVVTHGVPAILYHESSADAMTAGATISIEITAADSDGNIFPIEVGWTGSPTTDFTVEEDIGKYSWHGTTAGNYTLEYTHAGTGLTGVWAITVSPSSLETLEMTITPGLTVSQQDTITVSVRAFDAFGNEISVPGTAVVYHGGELHQTTKRSFSEWQIYMVDAGTSEITVVAEEKYDSELILVEQTVFGFFEEGGTIYYIGAGFVFLILAGLIAMLVVLLRRSSSDDYDESWEEDYEDEPYYEDESDAESDEPVADMDYDDAPHEEEESDGETQQDITVDEDGVEWWEDEEGVWWYRSAEMDDWEVWED
ncbi:MAG: DNRLRE domain-containing protein [Candidatus Thalassarchaeaceae archaeon]|nr:DNRLRE domain-containing protein [Candidatus Thalassarchaeaceae archaeon]